VTNWPCCAYLGRGLFCLGRRRLLLAALSLGLLGLLLEKLRLALELLLRLLGLWVEKRGAGKERGIDKGERSI
jgi:hypothetical protein